MPRTVLEFAEGLAARAPEAGPSDLREHTLAGYVICGTPICCIQVSRSPVRERIEALLDEIEKLKIPAGATVDLEHFSTLIRDELDRRKGNLRQLGRGVFVAPLNMAVGCQFEVVHILGMSEGSYPRRDRDDPLLPDPVKVKLDPTGETMPDRQRRALLERWTFLTARNAAHDAVSLLAPR